MNIEIFNSFLMYNKNKSNCIGIIFFYSSVRGNLISASTSESSSTSFTSTVLAVVSSTESGASLASELSTILLTVTSLGASSYLTVGSGNNLSGKSKVSSQILDTLSSKVYVVVLPVEGNTNESPGLKRFHEHENLEVGGSLNVGVGRGDSVLLYNKNTLTEEVLVNCDTVGLGDKHDVVLIVRLILKLLVQHEKLFVLQRVGCIAFSSACRSSLARSLWSVTFSNV